MLAIASDCTYSGPTIINNGELRIRTTADRLPTGTDAIINSPGIFEPERRQSTDRFACRQWPGRAVRGNIDRRRRQQHHF
jgi:hypothetical protein